MSHVDVSPITNVPGETNTFQFDIHVDPGTVPWDLGAAYDGSLLVHGAGVTDLLIPLRVRIRPSPWLAGIALVVAIMIGSALRWWNGPGKQLRVQRQRRKTLAWRVQQLNSPDEQASELLREAKYYLDHWNATSAQTRLDDVEARLKEPPPAPPTANQDSRDWNTWKTQVDTQIDALRSQLNTLLAPHRTVAGFTGALGALRAIRRPRTSGIQGFLLNVFLPTLVPLLTIATIGLWGYSNQYLNKLSFGASGLGDWLTLFGWGFTAGYAGKTVSDFFTPKSESKG